MRRLFRWLFRIFMGFAVLAALALGIAYWMASRSLPFYSAGQLVEGISGPVEIVRDNHNVPHVFAGNDPDTFFGLGFAHAQDRLWQMMMLRRTAQGRLSEAFGQETLKIDEYMRRLDLYELARRSVEAQDPATRAALEGYAAGVNAWLRQVNSEALGRGAPEFFLFSNQIAPWHPADSIAILKLLSVQLSGHLQEEVLRARLSLALNSPERLVDILPDAPGEGIAALPDYAALFPTLPRGARAAPTREHLALDPVPRRGFAGASNAWAAVPDRSAAGGSLLANDPHLGFTAPSIWYLARLELASGGVIGGTIPGVPLVMSGRSAVLGWGITSSYLDDQDVFIEKLNPENPEEYLTPDGYKPFETRKALIGVKGGPALTITLLWTENGPVLPRGQFDLGLVTPDGHVTALAWTMFDPADTTMTAGMHLMKAASIDEALAAGELYIAPSQNLTLADQQTVAMQLVGAMPKRLPGHQSEGRIPAPGWIEENRWQGRLPYAVNPRFTRPAGGIVGNTNNKIIDREFPLHVSYAWGDTQRIQRWRKLMENREVHTRDSFIEAQLDTVSFTARAMLPLIARDLWFKGEPAAEGTPERLRQDALMLLAEWNGEMNEHLPEPLIYAAWLNHLQDRLARDELGPLIAELTHPDPVFIERVFRDVDGAGVWCDVIRSTETETCPEMARLALDDALLDLSERYGGTIESWRWGDAHVATHDHQVLGRIPLVNWFVNIRQSTSGGDNTLLRGRTAGTGAANPFANVHGAGYRGVYDFADPDSSVFVISTGQSGHFLSRHYDDLGELWRRGEYIPMSLDPALARAAGVGITNLYPR